MSVRLLVGLGNPGPRFRGTRHNVGFDLADRLAAELGAEFSEWKGLGWLAEAALPGEGKLFLAKPGTFMNLSGQMVGRFANYGNIAPEDVLVAFDDIALPLGSVRIRRQGSAGGHKGMVSILEALGTETVPRLRVGVGPTPFGMDAAQFVLDRFKPSERAVLESGMDRALDAARTVLREGVEAAMNRFNKSPEASA